MEKICSILELTEKCSEKIEEIIPLCVAACTPTGLNPRGIMGDTCVNYHPTDSKHSCAGIMSLQEMSVEDNLKHCENILQDDTVPVDTK